MGADSSCLLSDRGLLIDSVGNNSSTSELWPFSCTGNEEEAWQEKDRDSDRHGQKEEWRAMGNRPMGGETLLR